MKAMFLPVLSAVLLAGCADPEPTRQREPGGQAAGERESGAGPSPTARPVSIGEGGPRFAACQGRGRVGGLRGGELPLRDAPFDSAKQVGTLADDAPLYICTRSLDQQWLGVVVRPVAAVAAPESADSEERSPPSDCGVTSPVRAKRPYDGPCLSGWVEATFVAVVAN